MKLYLFYLAFLIFSIYHFTSCEDWTHNDDSTWEEDEKLEEDQETGNFKVGIVMPWVKASRSNLLKIPKHYLVPIVNNRFRNKKHHVTINVTNYFCRVAINRKIKLIGQVSFASF